MTGWRVPDDARRDLDAPSAFFREHEARLVETAALGPTLDLACGRGRHTIAAADLGLAVVAVDRNRAALDPLGQRREGDAGRIEILEADLESERRPPLEAARFGAILVFRYLHRPLVDWIQTLLAEGGILLYETFTRDQKELGWGPRCGDFLLRSGELPTLFPDLDIELYEEGPSKDERPARTARLLASQRRRL